MERIKQVCRKFIVFVRAGFAAVALGLIETFGSPRGRRLLAVLARGRRRLKPDVLSPHQ